MCDSAQQVLTKPGRGHIPLPALFHGLFNVFARSRSHKWITFISFCFIIIRLILLGDYEKRSGHFVFKQCICHAFFCCWRICIFKNVFIASQGVLKIKYFSMSKTDMNPSSKFNLILHLLRDSQKLLPTVRITMKIYLCNKWAVFYNLKYRDLHLRLSTVRPRIKKSQPMLL